LKDKDVLALAPTSDTLEDLEEDEISDLSLERLPKLSMQKCSSYPFTQAI